MYAPLGPTHEAIEDLAIMRALPNMTAVAVADADEMAAFMETTVDWPGPIYVRLAKGGDAKVWPAGRRFEIGESGSIPAGWRCGIAQYRYYVATLSGSGPVSWRDTALPVALSICRRSNRWIPVCSPVSPMICVFLVTVEEHTLIGGLGSAVLESLSAMESPILGKVRRLGLPDSFIHHYGTQNEQLHDVGLDAEGIAATVMARLKP